VAVEVSYDQEGEGGVGRRGRVDGGGEAEKVRRRPRALRGKIGDGEEEGGAVLRSDNRANDSGGGGTVGLKGGGDAEGVVGERIDGAVRVVEERDASSTNAVVAGRDGTGLVEVCPLAR